VTCQPGCESNNLVPLLDLSWSLSFAREIAVAIGVRVYYYLRGTQDCARDRKGGSLLNL